jgi:CDGSH-type Zn-finger protein
MRVIVLGGTRFIGRVIVETLTAAGHAVLVVYRGINEPADLRGVEHLHAERRGWPGCQAALATFGADAAVDVSAANGPDARSALAALPSPIALVALSSVDVYRAYGALHGGMQTDAVPLTEESPLRGNVTIFGQDHTLVRQDTRVALCRCGASANKPFCDGSHHRVGFRTTRGPA